MLGFSRTRVMHMSKFKETCARCPYHNRQRVGDSFDRADAWYCFHPYTGGSMRYADHPIVAAYRDEKDGAPEIPAWCPLPDIKKVKGGG